MTDTLIIDGLDENYYDRISEDMKFYAEYVSQQREMVEYVNECIILSSGNRKAIQEMVVLQEGKTTDKIKAFFEKIKNIFTSIFKKMGERLTGWLGDVKKYMDKYADIINKNQFVAGNVEMLDHFTGYPRILDVAGSPSTIVGDDNNIADSSDISKILDSLTSAENITAAVNSIEKEESKDAAAINELVYNEYIKNSFSKDNNFKIEKDDNGNTNYNKTFTDYFNGGSENISFDENTINNNFKDIINTLYASPDILLKLQNIQNIMIKKLDDTSKNLSIAFDKAEKNINQIITKQGGKSNDQVADDKKKEEEKAAAGSAPPTKPGDKTPGQNNTTPGQSQTKTESVLFNKYNSYFTEDNTVKIGGGNSSSSNSNSNNKQETSVKNAGTNEKNSMTSTAKSLSNMGTSVDDKNANSRNVSGVTDDNKDKLAEDANNILEYERQRMNQGMSAYSNIVTAVCNSLIGAFEKTQTDYYAIIRAHVKYYLSNQSQQGDAEHQTTRANTTSTTAASGNTNGGSLQDKIKALSSQNGEESESTSDINGGSGGEKKNVTNSSEVTTDQQQNINNNNTPRNNAPQQTSNTDTSTSTRQSTSEPSAPTNNQQKNTPTSTPAKKSTYHTIRDGIRNFADNHKKKKEEKKAQKKK